MLPRDKVLEFLEQSWLQGYESVSFSGGEPMIFEHFAEVLSLAKQIGYRTSMVTNGTYLPPDRWRAVSENLDLFAISIDGPEHLHNRIRNSPTAYARMVGNLPAFRQRGIPFGFVHTLTCESLPYMDNLATFASQEGAGLLQFHPLGLVGAGETLTQLALDGEGMSRAYLQAYWLHKKFAGTLDIHVDLFNAEIVKRRPQVLFSEGRGAPRAQLLSDLINPLILKTDGTVNPVCHGIHSRFSLGNVFEDNIDVAFNDFKSNGYNAFQTFCSDLWSDLQSALDWPYFNWYEQLEKASLASGCSANMCSRP